MPPGKSPSIALMVAGPKAAPPPDDGDGPDDESGEIPLQGGEFPSVYLPAGPSFPSFLTPGYEGEITFDVKVTQSDENGLCLDLMAMKAMPSGPQRPKMDSGDDMNRYLDESGAA